MVRISIKKVILGTALTVSLAGYAGDNYKPGSYDVDPMHSKVGFEIPHLVISTVEGRFGGYKGELNLAPSIEKSTLQAEVDVATIETGVKDRDSHLKSPDFFDAAKYPKMIFKSKSFKGSPESFKIVGDLTMRGVTKEVTLNAKYLGSVVDAYGNQKVAVNAEAKVNRKDFGLTWGKMVEAGPVVGDEVTISLKLQAAKPQKQQAKK